MVSRGVGPSSVNLGPPNISEGTRARKLKLKSQLDNGKELALSTNILFLLGASRGTQNPLSELYYHLLLSVYYQRWEVEI